GFAALAHPRQGVLQLTGHLQQLAGTQAHFIDQGSQLLLLELDLPPRLQHFLDPALGLGHRHVALAGVEPLGYPHGNHGQQEAGPGVDHFFPGAQLEDRQRRAAAIQPDQPAHEDHRHRRPERTTAGADQYIGEDHQHHGPEDVCRMQSAELVDQLHRVAEEEQQGQIADQLQTQTPAAQYHHHADHAQPEHQRPHHQGAVTQARPLDAAVQRNEQTDYRREGDDARQHQVGWPDDEGRDQQSQRALQHGAGSSGGPV